MFYCGRNFFVILLLNKSNFIYYSSVDGLHGGTVVEQLRYKPVGVEFFFPMWLLEVFSDSILPAALWSWG